MRTKDVPKIIVNKNGISAIGLLIVLLIILKLTGNITISWWWVFSPIWIPWVIVLGLMAIILIGGLIIGVIILIMEAYDSRKNKW